MWICRVATCASFECNNTFQNRVWNASILNLFVCVCDTHILQGINVNLSGKVGKKLLGRRCIRSSDACMTALVSHNSFDLAHAVRRVMCRFSLCVFVCLFGCACVCVILGNNTSACFYIQLTF